MANDPKPTEDPLVLGKLFAKPLDFLRSRAPSPSILAADCVYALDANALIAIYKVEQQSLADIRGVLTGLAKENRLCIPVRAIQEYLKNRTTAVRDVYDQIHTLISQLTAVPRFDSPMLEGIKEYAKLQEVLIRFKECRKESQSLMSSLQTTLQDWSWDDPVTQMYAEIITDQILVGPDATDEKVLEDTRYRSANQIPPGYKDKSKADLGIGDVHIWHSLIALGKKTKKHVLFVSNEEKADWIVRTQDRVLLPRSELCAEFFGNTGCHFALISLSRFLELNGAKPGTVGAVRRVEETDSFRFKGITNRIYALLKTLAGMAAEFESGNSAGEEYELIRARGFEQLCSDVLEAIDTYRTLRVSESGVALLSEVSRDVAAIQSFNGQLEFMAARMKESGDAITAELKSACRQFLAHVSAWEQWCLAGSPT